jgi:superfamily II DNA helicase RecQ
VHSQLNQRPMSFRTFRIPVSNPEPFEGPMNTFIQSHRILKVERHFVADGEHSFWTFCIDFMDGPGGASGESGTAGSGRSKIDYREVLKPDEFALFSRLRELRKELAATESVPVYVVFTNEQLAQVIQRRVTTRNAREQIDGVGGARMEKYGQQLLDCLSQLEWPQPVEAPV